MPDVDADGSPLLTDEGMEGDENWKQIMDYVNAPAPRAPASNPKMP